MEDYSNIDEYIAGFPETTREILEQLRSTIRNAAPEAIEIISYGMPAFKQEGMLVYFAAYKNHIGFYPTGSGIEAFKDKLTGYKVSKGTMQFPLDSPVPLSLVAEIVSYRLEQNLIKAKLKTRKLK
jgi:uncharacterized protein YdhG (YjbR/CyaY superfamily)